METIDWKEVAKYPDRYIADLEQECDLQGTFDEMYLQLKEIAKNKIKG